MERVEFRSPLRKLVAFFESTDESGEQRCRGSICARNPRDTGPREGGQQGGISISLTSTGH